MDESRRSISSWWRVLAFPLFLFLMVPLVILMACAYYLRAVVYGVGQLLGWSGRSAIAGNWKPQPPHFSEISRGKTQGETSTF